MTIRFLRPKSYAVAERPAIDWLIREPISEEKADGKIEQNPEFHGLRVRVVAAAGTPLVETDPNHPDRKATAEIPPSEAHGGLRVKTITLPDHASEALSALARK
jgi:hypothetical protein